MDCEPFCLESKDSKFVGPGPLAYKKKNLPGRGLTKVEKHCLGCENSELSIATQPFLEARLCAH